MLLVDHSLPLKLLMKNFKFKLRSIYYTVNFSSLPKIIDLLGGVDINITAEEVPHIQGIDIEGPHTLTGEQALSYSRIRYATGGDFVRTDRQRTVLNSLLSKFLKCLLLLILSLFQLFYLMLRQA